MGGLCSPNMATSLISQYGQSTILRYVQSIVGQQLIGSQFSGLTNTITQLFNSNPQTRSNPGLLNNIIQTISGVQAQQTQKIIDQRPRIPQLDNLQPAKRDGILSGFQNQFSNQLNTYKAGLLNQLAPSLSPATYLNKFGLGNLLGGAGGIGTAASTALGGLGGYGTSAATTGYGTTATTGLGGASYGTGYPGQIAQPGYGVPSGAVNISGPMGTGANLNYGGQY